MQRRKRARTGAEEEEVFEEIANAPVTPQLGRLRVEVKCKNENQKKLLRSMEENIITLCSGPAGTGKTYVACAQALKMMKADPHKYRKIVLFKSATVLEGEEIGFLKGSMEEKMLPIALSFLDNFYKIIGEYATTGLVQQKVIDIKPLAFIRGLSIDNAIIIVDEAQNITMKNMRSAMTRVGEGSKLIITGDTKQIDIKNRKFSSLDKVIKIFAGKNGVGTIEFTCDDIVRNPIIMMIEDEFDRYEMTGELRSSPESDIPSAETSQDHS